MRHTSVLKTDQGFTVLEILTVVVIVGILAAFSAPSFLAWNQRKQADAAISSLEGAIKEAQRQAMSKSRTCDITFTTTNPPQITSTDGCLPTGDRTLKNVSLASSRTTTSFDHLGLTFDKNNVQIPSVTVTLTHNSNTNLNRCLVISSPLGLIGKGENPSAGVCNP